MWMGGKDRHGLRCAVGRVSMMLRFSKQMGMFAVIKKCFDGLFFFSFLWS